MSGENLGAVVAVGVYVGACICFRLRLLIYSFHAYLPSQVRAHQLPPSLAFHPGYTNA